MKNKFIEVDVLKYVERGLEYRGFCPVFAKKKQTEEFETFIQPWENIIFTDKVEGKIEVREEDYLNITDLSSICVLSKETFDENYEVINYCEKGLRKSL